MLLQSYRIQVSSPPCDPGTERWTARVELDDDIGEVLPYLNAALKGAAYNHAARALIWRSGRHTFAIRPREIQISNLLDRESAVEQARHVAEIINRTWERRAEIIPSLEMRPRLKPMEVYRLLPGTNCRACGQPTCFTFGLKVTVGEAEPENCPPLFTEPYRDKREQLLRLLEGAMGRDG